jgi:DNA topoisomerase-1
MPTSIKKGMEVKREEISAAERCTMGPQRYTEASLVHKMEELGIGRPSTYAPTISTIQQREYVVRGDKKGKNKTFSIDTLKGDTIESTTKKEVVGNEKGKLLPTDIGIVVNDFLMEYFPEIMDYNFTANVEEKFDAIAEGTEDWHRMLKDFYKHFEPTVEKTMKARSEHKAGERILGTEPKSGKPVSVKIGRYGPVVQIGSAEDKEKPRFAQMPKEYSLETITLEDALDLFKLPRNLGKFENSDVVIGTGRFGAYIVHNKKYVTLPKKMDPMTVTFEEAVALIEESRNEEKKRHIKTFEEDANMEVMNGRYGPYITYEGKNYRLPKALHSKAAELSYEECMNIVNKEKERS